jgi:hypothetical protein
VATTALLVPLWLVDAAFHVDDELFGSVQEPLRWGREL